MDTSTMFPIVLEKGKKLFGSDSFAGVLKLVGSTVSASGVTVNRYARAGISRGS